jgi:hypothetical protein
MVASFSVVGLVLP